MSYYELFTKPIKNAGTAVLPSNGTLYIKIKSDGNKGNIHVSVRSASSVTKLVDVQLAPGQSTEKTLTDLQNGPQSCYLITFDWPQGEFHNMSASTGNTIAWGVPITANNAVLPGKLAATVPLAPSRYFFHKINMYKRSRIFNGS